MDPENFPSPPPYNEDTNFAESCFREAEIEKQDEILTYHFDFSPDTVPLSVPYPTLWLTRDVDIKDWITFLACLPEQHGAVTEAGDFEPYVDEIAWRRKISNVLAEWNKNFFGTRGLHVVPTFSWNQRLLRNNPNDLERQIDANSNQE